MNRYSLLLISSMAIFAAGCASNSVPDPDADVAADTTGRNTSSDDYAGSGETLADDSSSRLATIVYFEFDQAELGPEYIDLLAGHANRLSNIGRIEVRLEGHADERGSREYNIGLGERRSQTVRRILLANGVSESQLSTISYGEERPAIAGSNQQSYARNRRVEINYLD